MQLVKPPSLQEKGQQRFRLHLRDHHLILVEKLTLVVEIRALLSSHGPLLLKPTSTSIGSTPVQLSGKAHKDYNCTVMIAIVHWHLYAETHLDGCSFDSKKMVVMCRESFRTSRELARASKWGLNTSWWMQTETTQVHCIHKVRLRPATRSTVATRSVMYMYM